MVFTWSSKDLCIIFRQWRITGPLSFLLSLVLIVLLTAGYEGVRQVTRKYEAAHHQRLSAFAAASATSGRSSSSHSAPWFEELRGFGGWMSLAWWFVIHDTVALLRYCVGLSH